MATLYAALAGTNTTSDLYTVDPATGALTSVGPIGFAVTALAYDKTTSTLYGATSVKSAASPMSLITIDVGTGAGTLVGAFGQGAAETAHDMDFDSAGQLWGWGSSDRNLWSIDKATGAVTIVGGVTDRSGGALGFDSSDVLWNVANWNGNIDTVSTADGSQTIIRATSDPGNYAHSGKFDSADLFWASYPGGSGHGADNLVTIDVSTGTVTVIGAFSTPGVGGLAWVGPSVLTARFTGSPVYGLAPLTVNFTDQSIAGPSGPITAWDWDFGDGSTHGTTQNPTHVYSTPGTYSVTLTVTGTSPDGTASQTRTGYIRVVDPADFKLWASLAGSNLTSDLYTVDTVTGAMTSVGPMGVACSGLAFDPATGLLYGATSTRSTNNPRSLVQIDPTNGSITVIGQFPSTLGAMHDIAFDSHGQLWGVRANGGGLVKINKADASYTLIGGGDSYEGGLDFDNTGALWKIADGASRNVTLDTTTGAPTVIASTPAGYSSGKYDLSDTFWAGGPGATGHGSDDLVTIDPNTGAVTVIAAFGVNGVGGLAWGVAVVAPPDFTLTLVPSTIYVAPGVTTEIQVQTVAHHSDTESITLSAVGAPSGIHVSFTTNPITAGDTTPAVIVIDNTVALGTYSVTIHAVGSGGNTHDATLTIEVLAEPPGFHIGQ